MHANGANSSGPRWAALERTLNAGFSFPLFLTTAHMVFSFIVLLPFMMVAPFRELHRGVLTKQWKGLVCVGACDPAFCSCF